jgi:hypothetical protein
MRAPLALAAVLVLAACAAAPGRLADLMPGRSPETAAADAGAVVASGQRTLVALVEATKAGGTLAPFGANGTHETWRSGDGVGLTFDRGVLFATRGLGADLYTAETAPVLSAWPDGSYARTVRHLDGENRVVATRLDCRLDDQGMTEVAVGGQPMALRHAAETCRTPGGASLRNDYWRDARGTMRQSRQWVSRALGHVTLQQLTD